MNTSTHNQLTRATTYEDLTELYKALKYLELTPEDIQQGPALGDMITAATKASSYKEIKTLSYFFYAIVSKLCTNNCFGCQNDRPGQHEHNCSGWDYYDPLFHPITMYFREAVRSITRVQLREAGGEAINTVLDKYPENFGILREWLGEIYYKHLENTYEDKYETTTCHCMNCLTNNNTTGQHPGRPEV